MSKRIMLITVVLTMVVSLACISAGADNVTINTSGTTPFLYEGHSYLPLKSVASFLDAPLRWDAAKGQAVITYNGQDLALTPGNANALFKGQPVVLPSPLGVLVERGDSKPPDWLATSVAVRCLLRMGRTWEPFTSMMLTLRTGR